MKTSFYAQMQECKQLKLEARNRGEGSVTVLERAGDFDTRDMDALELAIAGLLYRSFTDVWNGFRHELDFIVGDLNGAYADEIPF